MVLVDREGHGSLCCCFFVLFGHLLQGLLGFSWLGPARSSQRLCVGTPEKAGCRAGHREWVRGRAMGLFLFFRLEHMLIFSVV